MKKLLLLLTIFPFLAFGQVKKMYREALRTSNLKERISILNEAIKLEPQYYDAIFQRGLAKNNLGDYRGAIADYSRIIINKQDANTFFNRGNAKYSLQDFSGAKADYAKAYFLDDDFIDALYSLACVKLDLGEFENAITDFSKILKIAPDFAKVYILRGHARKALKDYEIALKDYNTAILIEPSIESYYNRGIFFMELNYLKEAKNDLSIVLRADKNNAYSYFYRGAVNLFLGLYDDAASDFKKAKDFDTMDFDTYLGLAMAYQKLGSLEQASVYLKKANSIIAPGEAINTIEDYKYTFWHQNYYHYFNNSINAIVKAQ
ncbi:tetratricopeptide repeat protein [Neotamlana laminarinivorans]|uniref:Tetratricopeptide repeat protein n=1 Tax=Neotamlana laminarinivorans TaxID=2883124 RepID=A0A9X1I218_9FLAO|nr:tetratricopeptide repeat protein [Tamlana laminarinivorans]MCB4799580.1 hypothetical protein [Tamlana laminarinivorans]